MKEVLEENSSVGISLHVRGYVLRFAQTMSIQIDVSMFHDGICLRIMFSGQHKC